jgi:hypothetical protein
MRKFILLFLSTFSLFSAPVENPAFPSIIQKGFWMPKDYWLGIRTGYEGDFVADAKLEQFEEGNGRVDDYTQESNCGAFTLNFMRRVDVFTVLGSSRTYADWRFTSSGLTQRAQVETLYDFIWGVGTRGILFCRDCWTIGAGARYESAHYNNLWITIDGAPAHVSGSYLHWREWQVDLDFAYNIDIFTPYIGVKYSNARTVIGNVDVPIANDGSGMNQFKNRIPVGVFIGCTLSTGKYFMLNVEGRLVDEEAVTISGDIRF